MVQRLKNARTEYYVAPLPTAGGAPTEEDLMALALGIADVSDDTDESTENIAWYSGDGTPQTDVVSVAEAYTVEGQFIQEDAAQAFIASLKRKIGDGRKLWLRKIETNGEIVEGPATATDIISSGGPAEEYAPFSCRLGFDNMAEVTGVVPGEPEAASSPEV